MRCGSKPDVATGLLAKRGPKEGYLPKGSAMSAQRQGWATKLIAGALLLLLPGIDASCSLNIPRRPRQGRTLKLIKRDWASHELVTEVAAILLEEILMYDVVRVAPERGPVHDFRAISLGEADANFEVWQGGKEAQIQNWVRHGQAVLANTHSTAAASGLYTLKHTVDEFRQTEFYQYLRDPGLQWLFARQVAGGEAAADPTGLCAKPEWNCSDYTWQPPACRENRMRCQGLVFHDYTHYTQGILEQQIANNGLPLAVQYLTTVSKEKEIWEAFASKRHILFQYHYPAVGSCAALHLWASFVDRVCWHGLADGSFCKASKCHENPVPRHKTPKIPSNMPDLSLCDFEVWMECPPPISWPSSSRPGSTAATTQRRAIPPEASAAGSMGSRWQSWCRQL